MFAIFYQIFIFHQMTALQKLSKTLKKSQKSEYLKNEKSFLDEVKNIFHSFHLVKK